MVEYKYSWRRVRDCYHRALWTFKLRMKDAWYGLRYCYRTLVVLKELVKTGFNKELVKDRLKNRWS